MTIELADFIKEVKGILYNRALSQARIYLLGGREATNSIEFELGGKACLEKFPISTNPHNEESLAGARWKLGWIIMGGYLMSENPKPTPLF